MSEMKQIDDTKTLLKRIVHKRYHDTIEDNLKKEFIFGKVKKHGQKRRKNRKAKHMTRKTKAELGLFHIPRKSLKYENVLPMHELWCQYIRNILDLEGKTAPDILDKRWASFTQSVYKADYHGSFIKIIRSKVPSLVDQEGICILDTKNTFQIVCRDDTIRVLPKKESVFEFHVGALRFSIFGKHLCIRPAERSVKKVKMQALADL